MTDGTSIKCLTCGKESTAHLKRGVSLKTMFCIWCSGTGFKRWTEYDKQVALNKLKGMQE